MRRHEAIHLLLLVDTLLDDYTRSWTTDFAAAFDAFKSNLARDTKDRFGEQGKYWTRYGQFARTARRLRPSDEAGDLSDNHCSTRRTPARGPSVSARAPRTSRSLALAAFAIPDTTKPFLSCSTPTDGAVPATTATRLDTTTINLALRLEFG